MTWDIAYKKFRYVPVYILNFYCSIIFFIALALSFYIFLALLASIISTLLSSCPGYVVHRVTLGPQYWSKWACKKVSYLFCLNGGLIQTWTLCTWFNTSGAETGIFQDDYINAMVAGALVPFVAKSSPAVVLIMPDERILVHYEGFYLPVISYCWR